MALQRGLVLLTCGSEGNAIRFLYPLTIDEESFERGLGILQDVLSATASGGRVEVRLPA